MMSQIGWIIVAGAVATYLTRIGGHLVLARFRSIHPRVQAALNAVPAAVLTTLVAPSLTTGHPAEFLTLVVAALAALRFSMLSVVLIGFVAIIVLRQLLG